MENTFNLGDVVTLKSGGPKMTIEKIVKDIRSQAPNGFVKCTWFENSKRISGEFRIETLEPSK